MFEGLNIIVPFPSSHRNKYILLAVDYVLKLVEAVALPTKEVKQILEKIRSTNRKYWAVALDDTLWHIELHIRF